MVGGLWKSVNNERYRRISEYNNKDMPIKENWPKCGRKKKTQRILHFV